MNQLSPMPQDNSEFFFQATYPKSPFYVVPDRPVFSGKVIVLVNQNTQSAAATMAALIQDNRLVVLVGAPTDCNPTGPTELTPFKLPRTGLVISLPSIYLERAAPANGDGFKPDYWAENTVEDLRTGRDAPFEKAMELVRMSKGLSPSTEGGESRQLPLSTPSVDEILKKVGDNYQVWEDALPDFECRETLKKQISDKKGKMREDIIESNFGSFRKPQRWKGKETTVVREHLSINGKKIAKDDKKAGDEPATQRFRILFNWTFSS